MGTNLSVRDLVVELELRQMQTRVNEFKMANKFIVEVYNIFDCIISQVTNV